ncbi:MAG: isoprenylcysteine carboxylmethyltransferase family protein [Anaerolineales bacterium]
MNSILNYFLPIYFIFFFGFAFVWRSYLVWKNTGMNPYKLGRSESAHDYIGVLFRTLLAACVLVVVLYVFFPVGYRFLAPIAWLSHPVLSWTGIGLLVISLLWILTAQSNMGRSWRIGVDADVKTDLIQGGLFSISRNPIFLGMRVMLIGFFFILPNALTFAIWLLGDVLMQIQVRLEEVHLRELHGDPYNAYSRRVRRWL